MTGRERKDLAASVRQRLLNWSQQHKLDFQFVLTRYGIERLLYRLSRSLYRDRFVLKGAMLFVAWEGWSPRPTRDVDLLGRGNSTAATLRSIVEALCRLDVEPDGLVFHPESIEVTDIRDDQEYGGHRVRLRANLAQARLDIQVDVGYGDAVFPHAERITFPVLLDMPAPAILAYRRETVVAEKYHALVTLGIANSRMKDFYDLWLLARQFPFDGSTLARAMHSTFERRQTQLPAEQPLALTAAFYGDPTRQAMWRAFLNRNRLDSGEQELGHVAQLLSQFLLPPTNAAQREAYVARWPAGGPWQAAA